MVALACEICGSNSLSKLEDGNYQCDYCRTKYSPAQAQKLLVEGTVNVDRSNEASNLRDLAVAADGRQNYVEAGKYANRLLEINPRDVIGWYEKGLAVGMTDPQIARGISEMVECFNTSIKFAEQANTSEETMRSLIQTYGIRLRLVVNQRWSESGAEYRRPKTDKELKKKSSEQFKAEHTDNGRSVVDAVVGWHSRDGNIENLKIAVPIAETTLQTWPVDEKLREKSNEWIRIIKEADPNYLRKEKSGSCFVATATFGDYDAAPVVLLRHFRDEVLAGNKFGQSFIDWYYRRGPRLAEAIAPSMPLRALTFVLVVIPATVVAAPSLLLARAAASISGRSNLDS